MKQDAKNEVNNNITEQVPSSNHLREEMKVSNTKDKISEQIPIQAHAEFKLEKQNQDTSVNKNLFEQDDEKDEEEKGAEVFPKEIDERYQCSESNLSNVFNLEGEDYGKESNGNNKKPKTKKEYKKQASKGKHQAEEYEDI